MLYGIPGLPILMSYCPEQVMDIGEESYLVGPMVFFRIDRDGYTVSLQVADLYQLAEFLEETQRHPDAGRRKLYRHPAGLTMWTSAVFFCSGRLVRLFHRGPDAGGKGG